MNGDKIQYIFQYSDSTNITIEASNEIEAREKAMIDKYGLPKPFGLVARHFGETKINRYAVYPTKWIGKGLIKIN